VPTTATIRLRRKNFCPVADRLEKIKAVSRRPSCPVVRTNASLSVLGCSATARIANRRYFAIVGCVPLPVCLSTLGLLGAQESISTAR
jgi:hypothetical protein